MTIDIEFKQCEWCGVIKYYAVESREQLPDVCPQCRKIALAVDAAASSRERS